jgi:MYXO-CTERM domain-containing protein
MTRKHFFPLITTCLASLVLIGGALAPKQARACDPVFDECLADLELLTEGPLPLDGGLVWRPVFVTPEAASFTADGVTTVVVTPMGGGPEVPGTVSGVAAMEAIVWRPTAPLPADTSFDVEITFDNSALFCFGDFEPTLTRQFTVATGSETAAPLMVPKLTGEPSVRLADSVRGDTLVCCDGAFPTWTMVDDCGIGLGWSEGTCASLSGVGWLDATLTLEAEAVAATGGQVGYTFETEAGSYAFRAGTAEIAVTASEPICGKVRATRLATGEETVGPEVCFGLELQDMLGEQAIDPLPALEACVGQPYTCELVDNDESWDPNACTPWPDGSAPTTSAGSEGGSAGESDSSESGSASSSEGSDGSEGGGSDSDTAGTDTDKGGCACAAGPTDGWWGLAALLLPWLGRRRSRR